MLTAHLIVKDAAAAIAFYVEAFGAVEKYRLVDPVDGRVGHAELRFGDTPLMIADEYPDFGAVSPDTIGGSPVKFHLAVPDADAAMARALAAGGTLLRPVHEEFYGDRTGLVSDPFGYTWFIEARSATVSPEEMQRRWDASTNPGAVAS